ncbi:hypothetical protein BOTNAR_0751g00010 [Botryotinia narcissicola]|uniref:Uncharacterized protein n=1 Tax=Botryotinia narcissicola TaxID=278944 RepID=A0A4Z1H6G1_9HELO|nr:hypothetical protein BOTNAR_0751g00010 [Botryotinia narcissicola]
MSQLKIRQWISTNAEVKWCMPPSLFDADRGYSDQRITALHLFCGSGLENIAKVLIEYGAYIELEVEVEDTNSFRVGFDEKKTIIASQSKIP